MEFIFPPLEPGAGLVTRFGWWDVSKRDASRSWTSIYAGGPLLVLRFPFHRAPPFWSNNWLVKTLFLIEDIYMHLTRNYQRDVWKPSQWTRSCLCSGGELSTARWNKAIALKTCNRVPTNKELVLWQLFVIVTIVWILEFVSMHITWLLNELKNKWMISINSCYIPWPTTRNLMCFALLSFLCQIGEAIVPTYSVRH